MNEHGYVREIANRDERASAIATQYLALSQSEREQTLLVAGTNAERLSITDAIRSRLKALCQLHSQSVIVQLVSCSLTTEQAKHVANYKVGDYLSLQRDYHSTPLKKGELYKVEARHGDELTVNSSGGRSYRFNPAKYQDKQVYEAKNLEIAVGDDLRWTATDKSKGRINGQQIRVTAIEGTTMTVADRSGRTQEVSLLQPLAVDYNLVSTSYRAQGKTAKRVIVSATSDPTSSREPFYVKISRQAKELSVYTQDLEKLKSWVEHSNAKTNPLELLGENHDSGNKREQLTNTVGVDWETARNTGGSNQGEQLTNTVGVDSETARSIGNSNPTDSRTDQVRLERLCRSLNRTALTRTIGGLREVIDGLNRRNERLYERDHHLAGEIGRIHQQFDQRDPEAIPTTRDELTDPRQEREYRDPKQRLVEATKQKQIAESLLKPLTQLNEILQALNTFKTPALNDEKIQILEQALKQIKQDSSPSVEPKKLQALASAINQRKINQSMTEALSSVGQTFNQVSQAVDSNSLNRATPQFHSVLTVVERSSGGFEESLAQEERLVKAIQHKQIAQKIAYPLNQLKTTLQGFSSNEPLKNSIQLIEQNLKQLELEASLTVSEVKLKTLANAIAFWKIARSSQTVRADEYISEALQKFNQTINQARESFESTDHSLIHALTQLQSGMESQKTDDAFWQPEETSSPPSHIKPHHWQELTKSAIHPDLIALNAESLSGNAVYERLLDEKLSRMGTGQYVTAPMAREMKKYEQVAEGGWWGHAGIDALSIVNLKPGEQPKLADWGCFKPDHPRIDQAKSERKGKLEYRKYENPALAPRVPFLPQVSESLAEKIYEKHGINPSNEERQSGFWFVVKQYPQIPITITEGFKKTLSSLSQGVVTIGLSGVNHIYRANDSNGNKLPQRELNPEVAVFAQPGREFLFAYDSDTKPTTIVNVRRDRVRGIELLEALGCPCSVATWNPTDGKGLDDLIAAKGPEAYLQAHQNAVPSEQDQRIHYRTEYNKIVTQIQRELGSVASPRLDLEVYLRAMNKGELADGARVVGESDTARSLRKDSAKEADLYVQAIERSAGLYERLGRKADHRNLDELLQQTVERQMIALELEKEDLAIKPSSRLSRSR